MNARDIERELTVVLHRHAEAAMNRTDTRAELDRLQIGVEDDRGDRRRWAVGVAVAAAVAAIAGAALWSADFGDDQSADPAGSPTQDAQQVAQDYAEAFAAGDVQQAASYLAPGTEWSEVRGEMGEQGAWTYEVFLEPCQEDFTGPTGTRFTCPFTYHVLRSDDLGMEPFGGDSWISAFVEDGKVSSAQVNYDYGDNGQSEHLEAIWAYIEENHPREFRILDQNSEEATPAEERRAGRLFDRYVDEYVAEQTQ